MVDLLNRRLNHIKDVESCLLFSIKAVKIERDVDIRIELEEAIKVLKKEYCSFVL